jgi:hypothetical protein
MYFNVILHKITCQGIVADLVRFLLDLTSSHRPNRIHILFSTQANFVIMWHTFLHCMVVYCSHLRIDNVLNYFAEKKV